MKSYEKEFKDQAVKLSNEIGTEKAAKQLGVAAGTLSGWRSDVRKYQSNAFAGRGNQRIVPGTEREIELMKKNKELEQANEILKAALGFFAKSQKK